MGLLFVETLPGPTVFKCKFCKVDSASPDEIISKNFHGRYGRAYLFERVVNVSLGPNEERHLLSGLHTVNDIYCSSCQQILGWRYGFLHTANEEVTNLGAANPPPHCSSPRYSEGRLKYTEKAYEKDEKYKEGKYILEKTMVMKVG